MQTPTSLDPHQDRILILDFGSQYTQLIARAVRSLGVYCEIYACDVDGQHIRNFSPNGVILSGGPDSAHRAETLRPDPIVYEMGVPVLGICYGMQIMAADLGGSVDAAAEREYGYAEVSVLHGSHLLGDIADRHDAGGQGLLDVWMSHGDRVTALPEGFEVIGVTSNAPMAAIADRHRGFYGLQFHPEVTHTRLGRDILSRFVHELCVCGSDWVPGNIIDNQVRRIRETVRSDKVILGLSGGVDSSVVAALLHRAIGDQLTCIFVDNGLLRQDEGDQVMATFAEHLGVNVIRVDAENRFLDALAGESDPERKRKIIGGVFVDVFQDEAGKIEDAAWLAQGTIYPDVIESAGAKTGKAKVIKSHHNVGGLPETLHLKLLEPLAELFKDEVRQIGKELGLPAVMINRHPFPGPGLGVRILGEVKKEYADILRKADAIFLDELHRHDLYDRTSQAFAVFLPVRSVGVVGDNRAYDYVIALRAVETVDFMTANWAQIPYDVLARISSRIINEVRGVSRVTYDISSKPPATIEWE
ncbi:MAG: glutamine-hydrolyzing GMP synthase [Proteobacteria bacterium]|nr:MAG: glutamine-hydrolyzing GMP synthase [Pseudomonadota bacterium]